MHRDSAGRARVGRVAAAARKSSDVERIAVLEACSIRVLRDRETIGRKVCEARWNVPSVGSCCAIDTGYRQVSQRKLPSRTCVSCP